MTQLRTIQWSYASLNYTQPKLWGSSLNVALSCCHGWLLQAWYLGKATPRRPTLTIGVQTELLWDVFRAQQWMKVTEFYWKERGKTANILISAIIIWPLSLWSLAALSEIQQELELMFVGLHLLPFINSLLFALSLMFESESLQTFFYFCARFVACTGCRTDYFGSYCRPRVW
jgi:hypothetical protein